MARKFSLLAVLAGISAAFASFALAVERLAAAILDFIVETVANPRPSLDIGGASMAASGGVAVSIDPALYQRNRHEAGVSRRSAARNT